MNRKESPWLQPGEYVKTRGVTKSCAGSGARTLKTGNRQNLVVDIVDNIVVNLDRNSYITIGAFCTIFLNELGDRSFLIFC